MEKPKMLYLYLIEGDTTGYDVYSSAVVVAESMTEAANIHPDSGPNPQPPDSDGYQDDSWVAPQDVRVTQVGIAGANLTAGTVICASFHAG